MLALLAILAGAGDNEQAIQPKQPPPPLIVPIPIGKAGPDYRYRFCTDWTPVTRSRHVWRSGTRPDRSDRWEDSVAGHRGGRFREQIAESDDARTFATTGRNPAGSGGVGEGFEWSAFVGDSWTAGLDAEFTPGGPRVVVALTYYPFEGVAHRYGWSVLSGQLVHGLGWHLEDEDLRALYRWPQYWGVLQLCALFRQFDLLP
ncbi:MAG: hypothetical protein J0I06_11500 [Planctomycetes bacterium]|nr:hypothetical protein [Planctomycetota bacterium]